MSFSPPVVGRLLTKSLQTWGSRTPQEPVSKQEVRLVTEQVSRFVGC